MVFRVLMCAIVSCPFSASALVTPAGALSTPFGFRDGAFLGFLEGSYYNTNSNFDFSGNGTNLPNGNTMTETRFNFGASYDFSNTFGIYGVGSFKRNESVRHDPLTGPDDKTNTNFSDALVGANFLLWKGFVSLVPDISVNIPVYPPPGSDTSVLISDGAYVGTLRLFATKRFRSSFLAAYAGYSYRTQGLSGLIPYGVLGRIDLKNFFFTAGINGAANLNNDQYNGSQFVRTDIESFNDAGSFIYNSVDPSWTHVTALAGVRLGKMFVSGGVEQSLIGKNTDQGTRLLLLVGFGTAGGHAGGYAPKRSSSEPEEVAPVDEGGSGDFDVDTGDEDRAIGE